MTVGRRILLATSFAALLAHPGWAQEKESKPFPLPKSILLARSWDEAIKEATIRQVPILFTTALAT